MGNNSEFLRHDSDSIIDARAMHEIYLPSFQAFEPHAEDNPTFANYYPEAGTKGT